jgi:hypothetical protein
MGNYFAPNAFRSFLGLEETESPLINLLFLINKHSWDQLQIQIHTELSRYSLCSEACPTQRTVAYNKTFGKSDF